MTFDPDATQRATPPPQVPGRALVLLAALGAAAIVTLAFATPSDWVTPIALRLWLPVWLLGVLVTGAPLLDQRARWVVRVARLARFRFMKWGGGGYAAIAVIGFLWLELDRVIETVSVLGALFDEWSLRGLFRGLLDFGIESFLNGLKAAIWPVFWRDLFPMSSMPPAAVVAWLTFECARWGVRQLETPR